MNPYTKIIAQSYTKSELADLYGIHVNTLRNWLIKANIYDQMRMARILNIQQVELIFKKLGRPELIVN